eukprot:403350776
MNNNIKNLLQAQNDSAVTIDLKFTNQSVKGVKCFLTPNHTIAQFKKLLLGNFNIHQSNKILVVFQNVINAAENIIIQEDHDLQLLLKYRDKFKSYYQFELVIYLDQMEIDDGCFLIDLKDKIQTISPQTQETTTLQQVMMITFGKAIQLINTLEDGITLDMDKFHNLDQKLSRFVRVTAQGKQLMTPSQIHRFEEMWPKKQEKKVEEVKQKTDEKLITQGKIDQKMEIVSRMKKMEEALSEVKCHQDARMCMESIYTSQANEIFSEMMHIPEQMQQIKELTNDSSTNVSQKCAKCLVLLKTERETYYFCQECQSLYLCQKCEDIFSHNHSFLKVKPDPVLLNLDKLESRYREVDPLDILEESVYDNQEIIKRVFIIKNTGTFEWPEDTKLFLVDNPFQVVANTPIKMNGPVQQNESRKVSIKIRAPEDMGKYRLIFRLGIEGNFNNNPFQQQLNSHLYLFGKPITIEFQVQAKDPNVTDLVNSNFIMSSSIQNSQIINDDYLKQDQIQQEYKQKVRAIPGLTKEKKMGHYMLMRLGFIDFNKNQELMKNCKDQVQVVLQILIKEQKKQLY